MTDEMAEGSVCTPNIGPRERRKRMRLGVVLGGVAGAMAVVLLVLHVPAWARATVFLPLLVSAYGVLQAREKT